MNNILLITTVYRTGEKIYPIISELSKYFNIDVLHMFQMSVETVLPSHCDYRSVFNKKYDRHIRKTYNGPAFLKDSGRDGDRSRQFVSDFEREVRNNQYSLVLWDNNIPTKGGAISQFYELFKKYNIKVIGSPHGNRDYPGYKLSKRIGTKYDYSFVFGDKERKALSKQRKKAIYSEDQIYNRFLPAGIPSNDVLKTYHRGNRYILIIPNFTEPQSKNTVEGKFSPLTSKVFKDIKILNISEKYGCPIVIKEKARAYYKENKFRRSLKKYKNISFLSYCEDDNKLIADAKIVIGSPSTLMFKSIQLGIPTVLLRGHGMMGNFKDYHGVVDPSYKNVLNSIELQMINGRSDDYINRTISGGVDFTSIKLYVDYIRDLNGY